MRTLYAVTRSLGGETLVVVGNFSSVPHELPVDVAGQLVLGIPLIGNHQDIDSLFGSLEEFDLLLTEAHARGIKIVMDLVGDSPGFVMGDQVHDYL